MSPIPPNYYKVVRRRALLLAIRLRGDDQRKRVCCRIRGRGVHLLNELCIGQLLEACECVVQLGLGNECVLGQCINARVHHLCALRDLIREALQPCQELHTEYHISIRYSWRIQVILPSELKLHGNEAQI
jgi:hypothetical protein